MSHLHLSIFTIILLILTSCKENSKKNISPPNIKKEQQTKKEQEILVKKNTSKIISFELTEDNAIPFFFKYAKKHKENKVKVTTQFGSFTITLFNETPYHRANFIYLTKQKYFNGTYFHRVVKNFIIQGGNADNRKTAEKRGAIGRYLLPPDTKKGFKHHRGIVSMPSSNIDNPHKMASPYEFFIVTKNPGAYHLDGKYTAFGKVIEGMEVVDKINNQPTDEGEWPLKNISMQVEVID